MFKSLRTLAFATLLPFALPTLAQVNATLPANVQKALQTNKLTGNDLSLVLIPLDGPGNPTYYNADVSVNPASTMKLFTTYAALEMLGPTYQWKTEFYTDGQLKNGVLNGNLYLKGGGDPKLNMEKLWLLMRDLRANGVTKVTGDLVLDRSYFNIPQLPVFNDDGGDDTAVPGRSGLAAGQPEERAHGGAHRRQQGQRADGPAAGQRTHRQPGEDDRAGHLPGLAEAALQPGDPVRRHHPAGHRTDSPGL